MKSNPIRVYLDSSDYLNLYRENISVDYMYVKNFILKKLELGQIEIGISFPTIFEVLQKYEEKYKNDRLERAEFIKKICRGKAFPHFRDALAGKSFPNRGIFAPLDVMSSLSGAKLKARFKNSIIEAAQDRKDNLSRHMRRKISSVKSIRKLAKSVTIKKMTREDFGNIPVTDEFINGRFTEKFLTGEIDSIVFENELRKWLLDPVAFCSFWYEYAELENPILKIEEDHYEKIRRSIVEMQILKKSSEENMEKYKNAIKSINKIRKSGILPSSIFELDSMKIEPFKEADLNFDFSNHFGLLRSEPFSSYAKWAVEKAQPLQKSDLGDLMHLFYLVDVDIMRCDRRMSAIMTESRIAGHEKIEPSLLNLPNRIEMLIDRGKM